MQMHEQRQRVAREDDVERREPTAETRRRPRDAARVAVWERVVARDGIRAWELWLAVALAAFLRLWHIELTQVLDDQTGMLTLARQSVLLHALPVTSISNSIGAMHLAASTYFLLPFVAFTKNPLPAVVAVALWNVLGVALCYLFTRRYFGRIAAGASALLFATNSATVNYSRFLWPPNYLPTVLMLWALSLYAGALRGKRGWLVLNVALLLIAVSLHPVAAVLAPLTLAALVLAPRAPRLWEWLLALGVVAVLLVPTALFEVASSGFDLRAYAAYLHGHSHFDLSILHLLYGALDAPSYGDLGLRSPYAQFHTAYTLLSLGVFALVTLGWCMLTIRLALATWRHGTAPADTPSGWGRAGRAWRELRADARWRADALLWLWVTLPILALLRHSSQVYVHYLIVLYPALFIPAGLAVQAIARARSSPTSQPSQRIARHAGALGAPLAASGALLLVALLTLGQAARSALYPATLATYPFQAVPDTESGYGYPLATVQSLDTRLRALQRQQHVGMAYILVPQELRYRAPLDYLLTSEEPDHIGLTDTCLALPSKQAGSALVLATQPDAPAARYLAQLPGATQIARLPVLGSSPLPVYRVRGSLAQPADALPRGGGDFRAQAADIPGLRLEGAALDASGMLRLRWSVLGTERDMSVQRAYTVSATVTPTTGTPMAGSAECLATAWPAGTTLFTWVPLSGPGGPLLAPHLAASSSRVTTSLASSAEQQYTLWRLGPLRLLSAPLPLPPALTPDGTYTFTLH